MHIIYIYIIYNILNFEIAIVYMQAKQPWKEHGSDSIVLIIVDAAFVLYFSNIMNNTGVNKSSSTATTQTIQTNRCCNTNIYIYIEDPPRDPGGG